ncbi:MAG: hypothetical protein IPI79_02560 [Moraxellaceae bacterium]|nr:hypothetical protein [Moraxellaceae bacterium]
MAAILRLLILVGIVWLIYSFIRRAISTSQPTQEKPNIPPATIMQQCTHCGVHVPQHEAITSEGLFFVVRLIKTFIYNVNHNASIIYAISRKP